jgi:Glu-tRNA(Gln) amidotransferase subunit E-like FAD-binding protein
VILDEIYSPSAMVLCPTKDVKVLEDCKVSQSLLWPLKNMRLTRVEPMPSTEVDLATLPLSEFTTPIPEIFDGSISEEGIADLLHEYQEEYSDDKEIPEMEDVSKMSVDETRTFINNIGKEQELEITPRMSYSTMIITT